SRRPRSRAPDGSARPVAVQGRTLLSAPASIALSCESAKVHKPPTIPAVITVISTQPGTSPRSSPPLSWSGAETTSHNRHMSSSTRDHSFHGCSAHHHRQAHGTGPEREQHNNGEDQEDDGNHHQHFLASTGLDQRAAGRLAHV